MQIDFPLIRPRGLLGQVADATPCTAISVFSGPDIIQFGSLVVYYNENHFTGNLPKTPEQLEKPLGIALRLLHGLQYEPKSVLTVMRQGRVWVEAEDVLAPLDNVYVRLTEKGPIFTGSKENSHLLKGAIFLESQSKGLVPIEISFLGGR